MTSNNGAELPWKKVAKGSRSLTRRSKKPVVRVPASGIEAEAKSSTATVAGKPKPEKLGVSVLGQHFAERVEHVPIKKRRFIVRSPSPSKRPSTQREGSEHKAQINHALPVSRLNPNLISDVRDEKPDCSDHDFSGIKILADAACSADVSNDFAPAVDCLPAEESVVQQQDTLTISTHVEGNDSSAGTADVSHTAVDSGDQTGQGKSNIVAPQKYPLTNLCKELADEQSVEHSRVTSGGMIAPKKTSIALSNESSTERPKANVEAGESETLAPDSGAVTVSEKSSAVEPTEKNNEGLKDVKFHWDLNFPCDVEDEASGRDLEGEITESIAPKESERFDGSKDSMDGVIASDEHTKFSSPSGPNTEAAATNDKECQSGYDSQFEDGELREPYPWEEIGEVEQLDYGSEPENERFYSMDSEKGILADKNFRHVKCESGDALRIGQANEASDIEKQVVVNMSDSHPKKGSSSPSRSFGSKPYKEVPSHDAIQRRRPDTYEEVSTGPDRFAGRDDRSGMRMRNKSPRRGYFNGWDSKRRFSPPNYKDGSYGSGRPWPKRMADDRGMMNNGFDESGSGPGPEPDGYVRRQFSNGGYRGRFKRFPDGGDRKFRGPHSDTNQFPGRMQNRMSGNRRERGGSPVLRRLHYPQSESRSRSRSPVSWNSRNRSSPPPPGGLRADERTTERVRLPFQKRFPADQEMGYMSPPRNRMSSPRFFEGRNNDTGENHNSFRERKFRPGQRFDVGNSGDNDDAGENHNSFRERKFRPGQRFDVGHSMRRPNSDNNNLRPFIRNRRFEGAEENTGRNRFEMAQQRRTRRSEATEEGGDDIRRFKFNEEQPVVVANNDNNNKES
ncbi:hypothetical protein ARALYDRAFT_918303 [Arabidopsis lyrata subsp. lyrata]|uniref:Uncharacterized protein n=1 Tax=Arabidopsis lyrata subsp. lyrata TaxID=81972 RepID=D7MS59_ARALL|nr:uncharacterized protein LOC9300257 isoform X1 [Arabidopsis lyrata subsp. lyrata]XP_020886291.1 uncharacterized protein LOC9300257 isoform X1 [Arabidopsis lyrata subsp. lyrata]EFH40440.1 hypothetical protein ARALYDRAFT_918303 [Arabidopsis lyrata subsp. lyrata]|eukprot:XP_002864181.1 uncharacterized protein LOC9300257 isoform X1 [Arabidopsis lyrata subsp. lyrata]